MFASFVIDRTAAVGGGVDADERYADGQCVGERREVGGRAVRVAQGNGKRRGIAHIDRVGTEGLAERGRDAPGARTVKVSLAPGAVPLSVTKAPVVFTWGPTTDEVTVAVTVQKPLAGIVPAVKVTVSESFVIDAPQVQVALLKPTNVTPMGNVSLNDAKLAADLLGLLKVMVRD